MRDSFLMYRSFVEAIEMIPVKDQLAAYKAICHYALYGEVPDIKGNAAAVFMIAKDSIDINDKRAEGGRKGGRPKKTEKPMVSENSTFEKPMVSENAENKNLWFPKEKKETEEKKVHQRKEDKENKENILYAREDCPGESFRNPTKQYGIYGNVNLTDEQLDKLVSEFPSDWQSRIDRVSEYCKSKGVKYKDYLATIRSWARRDAEKEKPKKNNFTNIEQRQYNYSDLEAKLLGVM